MGAAAERGDLDTIRDLIKEGVNPKGTGMHAMTPLMRAAKGAQLEACRLLIRNGSDVNEHNDSGSVLMWAIDSESKDIVELLIENRVDLDWESVTGEGALSFAKEKKATDIIDILTREHGNSPR
jgi:ankyrin repeat protein